MMQLDKPHITTFNHPNFGDMVAVTNGSNNINDSRYLMSIKALLNKSELVTTAPHTGRLLRDANTVRHS
ncbi:hypothetical protein [Candidatus Symbiopectobacterium sp.]|uniref:hypothetical protein n=1 Tax=Candidatus Symbiopectobacterium sp. TaxID=2816440 RepID=UPI0025BB2F1C|nr:hypothetical protein [Candidatus Symbiopectobacterium sp.]